MAENINDSIENKLEDAELMMAKSYTQNILENAMIIGAKIARSEEVELFRVEFAERVKTFDPWNYIIDRWGLFNPPGVNYDDHDPDDDIPFNPEDFLGEG